MRQKFINQVKKAQYGLGKLEHLLRKKFRWADEWKCSHRTVRVASREMIHISNAFIVKSCIDHQPYVIYHNENFWVKNIGKELERYSERSSQV